MTADVSYSEAREHLAELWDRVLADREAIRLTRRGTGAVMLVAADEYEGLLETAHLLRSPANAARLLSALGRALSGEGESLNLAQLRADVERAEEV
jgi:antitoxin YefM